MININLEGQEVIFARFRRLDERLRTQAVARLADAVFEDVRAAADKHTKTNALARSVYLKPDGDGWEVGHNLDATAVQWKGRQYSYALFVHWGSKPHEIKARNKKALRFVGQDGRFWFWFGPKSKWEKANIMRWRDDKAPGARLFFKWPQHPGYKGDDYLVKAAADAPRHLERIIRTLEI